MKLDELRLCCFGDADERLESYSEFLNDGDFEEWQKYCYKKEINLEKLEEAQTMLIRALWIKKRRTYRW